MSEKSLPVSKSPVTPGVNGVRQLFKQYGGILSGMLVLIILFSFMNDSFFTTNNIINITLQVSIIAITAYGMTYVLLLGDIDLSVGSTIALIGTFAALGASWGIPFILLVPLSIVAALVLGLINGGLTALAGIPSFIVTVATMGIFRGIAYIVTDGTPVMIKNDAFLALGNGEFLSVPIPIWILLVLLLVNHFILTKTAFGRKIYITGGNKEAAVYSGINVVSLKIKVFMITAVLAGISGMILASRLYSGQPNSAISYELDAIAAAVLGGTSLNGGYGTVIGTMIGALTIGVINNGMNLMNVPYFYQMVVKGLVILVAVYVDVRNKRKRS
ncbi:TPA: ABC transporter permease [Citrobacter farmeri]|uniref:ABC transporter permease n=2 Tax=Citrobacter farmeri TaxID=67824 RepID=A0ACA8D1C5_9ENTR|nr:ABC transporter permease [Citrobacter farmeri]HAT2170473.1 ABC transporter permease [Citrobacter freundii]AST78010.1 ABC transporter permease [Citrobacter farmeri]EMB4693289.1 ABC transporter permease [Citrobacter farmeri]MCP1691436.1 ribose transport system permease protein [Citrobacter farmeri]MCW2422433.1 ribose transport system permease protein [Citrobacter farmeri]